MVITMLPDSPAVEAVVHGEDGVLAGASEGDLLVDMSTIHPRSRSRSRRRRPSAAWLRWTPRSAAATSAPSRARCRSWSAGRPPTSSARARCFEVLGKTIVHVGEAGAGQVVKACNQVVVAVTIAAVSEALVLGSKAGVDPEQILDVLGGGLAGNKVMEMRRRNFLEHDFTPGFRIDLHHKDLNIALESGDAYGVPLPVTGVVQQYMRALRAKGHGGDDHSGLLRLVEELAEHRIGSEMTATTT